LADRAALVIMLTSMNFEFFVALRYLRAKRRQAAISIITVISVLGVMAGVCALVISLAVNNGFREELESHLLSAMADVSLTRTESDGIRNYDQLAQRLAHMPHVVATASSLYGEVLVSHGSRSQGMVLKGIEPSQEKNVGTFLRHLREGSIEGLSQTFPNADPIVIGKDMATTLGAFVGDTLQVTSPQGYLTPVEVVPKFRHFRVVGIFDSGFYDFDNTWGLTTLASAQRLFDLPDIASLIEFKLDDIYKAPEMAEQIRRAAGSGFDTTTWIEQNHSLFTALRLERLVTILTIGLIVVVAALNIFIALVMMVMEKNRDIAVLMSMGARQRQVWAVFTIHGLAIGGLGTALGLILGYGFSWLGNTYKLIPLQADVYALSSVPFHAHPLDGVWIAASALTISFLATLYPSLAAARLNPVEILRYE
jgi:lipoprotein-releasing system permease protein